MSVDETTLAVGIPTESFPGERRVAVVPGQVAALRKAGLRTVLQADAGREAGFPDEEYTAAGATVLPTRQAVFSEADIILQVRAVGANPEAGRADFQMLRSTQYLIAMCDPLSRPDLVRELAQHQVTSFALELLPRITRAQSMDVLSSMATIAGYKAALLAANTLPRMFPMMMTAAGTITPARVLVVGAGVAGLQAIASCRKLGAVVQAYDVRPAVKEEVQSLGAKFVELELETSQTEQQGGYAKAMDEEFYRRQRELMARVVKDSDVVITTAAVPGKKAPVLVTAEMVEGMRPGSVVVDLAAEGGGNCEATVAGQTTDHHGVSVIGAVNVPSMIPYHASQMYSKNITTFLLHLIKDGGMILDRDDEIISGTLATNGGEVVHSRLRELLALPPLVNHDEANSIELSPNQEGR